MRSRRAAWVLLSGVHFGMFACSAASVARPDSGTPDVGVPTRSVADGHRDAAVIVSRARRRGGDELADAWARYLVEDRGVPRSRVIVLRSDDATPRKMQRALDRGRGRVRSGGVLWAITIGHALSPRDTGPGRLEFTGSGSASALDVRHVLAGLARGPQGSAIWIADECHPSPPEGQRAGLPATELQPGLSASTAEDLQGALEHAAAAWASPTEVAVITAGTGRVCRAGDASDYPWLAYGVLGALRGWGDRDDDGTITLTEAATYAAQWQRMHDRALIATTAADIALARLKATEEDPLPSPWLPRH